MKYIQVVDIAMKRAKEYGEVFIVFGVKRRWWFGYEYHCEDLACYIHYLNLYKRPVVKFMTIMPNGRAVQ